MKRKRKEAKCVPLKTCSAILPMDLNLLIYLAVRCHHATRERGQGVHVRSRLLAPPPKPLQIRFRLGYVSQLSRTAPFLASLIISHLLARRNLERMRKRKGKGWKEHLENLVQLLTASQVKCQDFMSENVPHKENTIPTWRCNFTNVQK